MVDSTMRCARMRLSSCAFISFRPFSISCWVLSPVMQD